MLSETLTSVRAQTFTDFEIIVVSNGESHDMRERSMAVATLAGAVWISLPKGNVSAARNFGIEQAKGDWIAFVDDDDLWLPNKLERQIAEACRTGADMVSCDYIEFYPDGREIIFKPRLFDGWNYTRGINNLFWWALPSGVILRRSAVVGIGGFDMRLRYCEDNDLWRRLSWRHHIHHAEDVLFRYRQGHASLMKRERLRYIYDLLYFIKMHIDTPRKFRTSLPRASFFWRRVMIICFPKWLAHKLDLNTWEGAKWHLLWSRRV
jgi:glycosyltransferase involved in cell wall biosynthesis